MIQVLKRCVCGKVNRIIAHRGNLFGPNEKERNSIREEGYKLSNKYTRDEWARKIIQIFKKIKRKDG